MCGGGSSSGGLGGGRSNSGRGKGNGAVGDFGGYGNAAEQSRAGNRAAMGRGSNISNGPGSGWSKGSGKQAMGAAATTDPAKAKAAEEAKAKAAAVAEAEKAKAEKKAHQVSSVFGLTGIDAVKEMEKAFTSKNVFGVKRGEISVPDSLSYDIEKKEFVGGVPSWSSNRGFGAIRDGLAEMVGSPYDRTVTPDRAKEMVSKGKGALTNWTEGLQKGNYQYDEKGRPAVDKMGMFIDAVVNPVKSMALKSPVGLVSDIGSLFSTAKNYDDLKKAGVFGEKPASPSTVSTTGIKSAVRGSVSSNPVSGMLGSDTQQRRLLGASRATPGAVPSTHASSSSHSTPKRTRQSLILTGPTGLDDSPNRVFRKLYGV
jgi:hypothetical protein